MKNYLAALAFISLIASAVTTGSLRASSNQISNVEESQIHLKHDRSRLLLEVALISDEVLRPDEDADKAPDDRFTGLVYNKDFGPPQPVELNIILERPGAMDGDKLGAALTKLNFESDGTHTYEKLSKNGFDNPTNRFIWSGAFDNNNGDYCCATFNQNWNWKRFPSYIAQLAVSPDFFLAQVDAFGRAFSGSPLTFSEGGEVWCKKASQVSWTLVFPMPSEHVGFRNMVFYAGQFYGASANGPNGPEEGEPYILRDLYKYEGGPGLFRGDVEAGSWERVDDRGHINGYDRSIRAMVVSSYSDRLFMGTETYVDVFSTARVLSYDAADNKWRPYYCGYLDAAITQATELERGLLLFGALNTGSAVSSGGGIQFGGRLRLYLLNEATDLISDVSSDLIPKHDQDSEFRIPTGTDVILELRVFNGELYVGALDFFGGFKFYRTWNPTDPARWDFQRISINGFKEEQQEQLGVQAATNSYTWSSAVVHDTYYIGTNADGAGPSGLAQLWKSTDGRDWKIIVSDAFNETGTGGFRTLDPCPDGSCLFVGAASNIFIPTLYRAPYEPGDVVDTDLLTPGGLFAIAELILGQPLVPGSE